MAKDKGAAQKVDEQGDDLKTEFERRCERLTELATEAEFSSGSLLGDVRDTMADLFKTRPKLWSQMSEQEMRDVNKQLEAAARVIIKKLVVVIAEEDDVSVHATIKGFSVKGDTFKVSVDAKGDEETALELFRMDGHDVVIVRADSKRFHGQRREGEVIPDQAAIEFADANPKPPADDSDLAGDDDGTDPPGGDEVEVEDDNEIEADAAPEA